ncbi:unnamed protein product, partial [Gongylonema pulchrum]|uniref:Kelch repeat protein n=1 Tax=Gongylonema pulchrum TaxID=637853 RepID=A0A183EDJ6_9BILA
MLIVFQCSLFAVARQWFMPQVTGDVPPGCAAFGIVCDNTTLYIFGGMVEDGGFVTGDVPPGCAAFGIVCDNTTLYIFGGMVEDGGYLSSLYKLPTVNWHWKRLHPKPPPAGQPAPCGRMGHSFVLAPNKLAYLFGGTVIDRMCGPRFFNDLYVLDLNKPSDQLQWQIPE